MLHCQVITVEGGGCEQHRSQLCLAYGQLDLQSSTWIDLLVSLPFFNCVDLFQPSTERFNYGLIDYRYWNDVDGAETEYISALIEEGLAWFHARSNVSQGYSTSV